MSRHQCAPEDKMHELNECWLLARRGGATRGRLRGCYLVGWAGATEDKTHELNECCLLARRGGATRGRLRGCYLVGRGGATEDKTHELNECCLLARRGGATRGRLRQSSSEMARTGRRRVFRPSGSSPASRRLPLSGPADPSIPAHKVF